MNEIASYSVRPSNLSIDLSGYVPYQRPEMHQEYGEGILMQNAYTKRNMMDRFST